MAVKKSELYSMLWEACNKLRGGVDPARYKNYVLVLLFHKYVSDKYKGAPYAVYKITDATSFDALIAAKGKPDIGERVDKIIRKFMEDNQLQGALPDVSFNDTDELGSGKELVEKVSDLIAVFQNPAIDFRSNRASDDDIIGDAYEYFMMKFAQESGKSKGQFYTPSEVSRVIARLIGIGNIEPVPDKSWTLYDPAAGSGSLLIRAADEAPVGPHGDLVSIHGQEMDLYTAGLANMNFVLHRKETARVERGNTLVNPFYKDSFGQLRTFDFIVMNPPFSDKSWSDGLKASEDPYHRFEGFGIPPKKNGDFAWFLHVIKSLNSKGKAGIVMPHGVLFRGNAEEAIRKEILKRRYIKGIVSLPANLFYGTGEPIAQWWIFKITWAGIHNAIFVCVRIICLILLSSALTFTTSPTDMTDALERLMKPLKIFHVKVHEIAMMMSIALRFVPTLLEETDKIMAAQKARGADMESGNFIARIKALVPVLIPLFVSAFRRAYELAVAMECRCYQGGAGRTRMKQLHMSGRDAGCIVFGVLLIASVVLLDVFFGKV